MALYTTNSLISSYSLCIVGTAQRYLS